MYYGKLQKIVAFQSSREYLSYITEMVLFFHYTILFFVADKTDQPLSKCLKSSKILK